MFMIDNSWKQPTCSVVGDWFSSVMEQPYNVRGTVRNVVKY